MTTEQLRLETNRKFGTFLKAKRARQRSTAAEIAQVIGFSERELIQIEETPAEVPCSKLHKLIEHYGPSAIAEAQFVLLEVGELALQHSRTRTSRCAPIVARSEDLRVRMPQWLEIGLAAILGRLLLDIILYLFRS